MIQPLPRPLLGPDGEPIPPRQEIPFIQWLPDGKSVGHMIYRGAAVHATAARFIGSGGRYAFVLRTDGMAEMVAGIPVSRGEKGELVVVACEVVPNGPGVGEAIDRLVAASMADLDALPITEAMQ